MASFGISLGVSLGLQLLSSLITPPQETGKLSSTRVPKTDYGSDIPRIRGCMILTGQMIWAPRNYREVKKKQGKIGGGKTINYTYFGDFAYSLVSGTAVGFNRLKLNGETKVNFLSNDAKVLRDSSKFLDQYCEVYSGSEDQSPNTTMQAADGAANVPAYRGLSYLFLSNYPLDSSGNRPPQVEAIVCTKGYKLTENFLNGSFKPIVWTSLNGATISNAPDDPLLGRCSFASGSGVGAHTAADSLAVSSSAALEVEYVVQGTGTYGLLDFLPVGSYPATSLFRACFTLSGSTLTILELGVSKWSSAGDYGSGVRLSLKISADHRLTYWVNGMKVYTSAQLLDPGVALNPSSPKPNGDIFTPTCLITSGTVGGTLTAGTLFSAERIIPTPVNLRALLVEICTIGGVTADVSGIDSGAQILGIALNPSGSPKDWILQLQQLYYFDVYQRGKTLVFRAAHRGDPVRTLTIEDLASAELNNTRPVEYNYKAMNPSELPGEVQLKYYDANDSNLRLKTVYSRAETNPSREKLELSVEAALTLPQAQAISDVVLNLKWLQKTLTFSLTIAHCDLEPGDIVTVPLWGISQRVMLTMVTLGSNLLLECEAVTQFDGLMDRLLQAPTFNPIATGYGGIFDQTFFCLLKIPKFREQDSDSAVYFGVGGSGSKTWTTAFLNASPDGTNWDVLSQTTTESTLGVTSSILGYQQTDPTPPAQPQPATGLDTVNSLIVQMYSGELQSITTEAFNSGGLTNLLLIGNEIVRFRDAVLIGESTYRVSYLDRGRNNTAVDQHALNERVVLLSTVQAVPLEPDQTGTYSLKLTFDQESLDEVPTVETTL